MKFEELAKVNVNDHTEKKNGLTYLSWAWAWDAFCKAFDGDADYKIYKNEQGLPYVFDPNTGYMCYVEVTAGGKTHEMWLPVMDAANNAMKAVPYTVKTRYKEVEVKPATMFDINKTIMRCLVKCLAMFGLGLYIYAGEDLPEDAPRLSVNELAEKVISMAQIKGVSMDEIVQMSRFDRFDDFDEAELNGCLEWLKTR